MREGAGPFEPAEALEAGLALDTQSEDLQGRLQASLASAQAGLGAQESARKEASEHVSRAEACVSSKDYAGAIMAYEAAVALDVNDASLTSSYQSGVETSRGAMSDAVGTARGKLEEGETAVAAQDWESAIACFTAGVSIEGTHDDDLSSSLRAGLESAESSKAARDAARGGRAGLLPAHGRVGARARGG